MSHATEIADDTAEFNPGSTSPHPDFDQVATSVRGMASLSKALRLLGALAMVASMSVFMLQGWSDGNDVGRYLLLLAQTGLLTLSGFALSFGLKENKGARVFFGLALLSIPANFTILGALFYSATQWDSALVSYPSFATWQLVQTSTAGFTLGGALLALIPLTLLCFAIMARRSARLLTLHFLLLNSLLLLPLRGSIGVGMMALVGVLYALYAVVSLRRSDGALSTPEGRFSLAALFVPTLIIVGRSLYFYQVDAFLVALLSMAVFLILRHLATGASQRVAVALDIASIPVAILVAAASAGVLAPLVNQYLLLPAFALFQGALYLDLARRTASNRMAATVWVIASSLAALCVVANVFLKDTLLTTAICVAAGLILAMAGYLYRQRFVVVVGAFTAIVGALFGAEDLVRMLSHSGWIELALGGAFVIALASVLDRHGAALRLTLKRRLVRTRCRALDQSPG